jgi:phage terminase large subunit-like protein
VRRRNDRWAGPLFDGHRCSVGYEVADWIQTYCCHGPGDVAGEPVVLDDEWFDFIIGAYALDPLTGRRQIDRALLSRPKGRAKSELAGFVVVAEALAPVRFDGWGANGQPKARPVTSPLIKCLATEESQAGNTFENAAFIAGEWGKDNHPDIYRGVSGARQYQSATALYLAGGGEMRACTAGSASKDGGKETFVVPDEVHLYVLRELKSMYATVARNTGKRSIAEPWMLLTTTAYRPGEQSVAEELLTAWRKSELPNPDRWLVDHREAKGKINLDDQEHTLRQLTDVYGAAADWMDLLRIYRTMRDPTECEDDATAARYFLNRALSTKDAWIALDVVERQNASLADADGVRLHPEIETTVTAGEAIALGFDGSLRDDATVLIGSRMTDGFVFPIGIWAKPAGIEGNWWEVPRSDVLASIREAFGRYDVTRLYADPHEWRSDLDTLAEEFPGRVITWETRRDVQMAAALDRLRTDLINAAVWHSGDKLFIEHFANAYVRMRAKLRLVRKEHPQSNRKIDSVVGAALAYEARADAIVAGWQRVKPRRPMVVRR